MLSLLFLLPLLCTAGVVKYRATVHAAVIAVKDETRGDETFLQGKQRQQKAMPSISHPQRRHHIARRRHSYTPFYSSPAFYAGSYTIRNNTTAEDEASASFCADYFIRPTYYVFLFRYALF